MIGRILLAALVLSAGCAHDPEIRATQKTAIGGGFVALGVASTIGTAATGVVGAAAAANSYGEAREALVLPVAIGVGAGALVAVGWFTAGFLTMGSAEADLLALRSSPSPSPSPSPRPSRRLLPRRESPPEPPPKKAEGRPNPVWDGTEDDEGDDDIGPPRAP